MTRAVPLLHCAGMAREPLRFTFDRCLGTGGFGEVYLAFQHRPGGIVRKVAVKILKPGIDGEGDAVRRLQDEGRMLAMLDHPSIIGVLELTHIAARSEADPVEPRAPPFTIGVAGGRNGTGASV